MQPRNPSDQQSWRESLHNAPARRSDWPMRGQRGYDAFVAGCHARHATLRDQWLAERLPDDGTPLWHGIVAGLMLVVAIVAAIGLAS